MNDERLLLRLLIAMELAAGVLCAVGHLTPPAGVLLVAVAATLVFVSWPHEYPLYLLFAAVALALTGGAGALGVGLGLAGAVMLEGARQLTRPRAMPEQENP